MINSNKENFGTAKEYRWDEVAGRVSAINPELAKLINEISPDDSYKLALVKYPYGSTIVHDSIYHLPNTAGKIVPASDHSIDKNIRISLEGYDSLPVGLILTNSFEYFHIMDDRLVPFAFYKAGKIFALWRNLDSQLSLQLLQKGNITAGARSIGMLPKITDKINHKRLRESWGIKAEIPKGMKDHWSVFVALYNSLENKSTWFTEVLFFSRKWMDSIKHDKAWSALHSFLLLDAWNSSNFWRGQMPLNLMFNHFIKALAEKNIKIQSKHLDVVRHLTAVSLGALPGFAPAIDETAAPIQMIQQVYSDIYHLKEYAPTIIQPQQFTYNNNPLPTYYSLQWPTLLENSPAPKSVVNVMTDLEEIHDLMQHFISFTQNYLDNIIKRVPLIILKDLKYDYYHSIQSHKKNIKKSTEISVSDNRFMHSMLKTKEKKIFCDPAQFLRGCIKISRKSTV